MGPGKKRRARARCILASMKTPARHPPPTTSAECPLVGARAIFFAFLRLGLTAFGGPAMVAHIRRMVVERRRWLTEAAFAEGVALCQIIPGATAIQSAAYAGLRAGGPRGALAAYVGFGLPAFALMLLCSIYYDRAREIEPLLGLLAGLRVVVVAIVAHAAWSFGRRLIRDWRDLCFALPGAICLGLRWHPILVIAGAALLAQWVYRRPGPDEFAGHAPAPRAGAARSSLRFAALLAVLLAAGLPLLLILDRRLLDLALLALRVDLFAFGGGYASLPLLHHEVVHQLRWLDERTFLDGVALGQITPGPIVITATFVGHRIAGFAGAIVGTLAIFAPSLLMVLVTAPQLERIGRSARVRRALRGVLGTFVGLLLETAVRFALAAGWSWPAALIGGGAFAALMLGAALPWVLAGGIALSLIAL